MSSLFRFLIAYLLTITCCIYFLSAERWALSLTSGVFPFFFSFSSFRFFSNTGVLKISTPVRSCNARRGFMRGLGDCLFDKTGEKRLVSASVRISHRIKIYPSAAARAMFCERAWGCLCDHHPRERRTPVIQRELSIRWHYYWEQGIF